MSKDKIKDQIQTPINPVSQAEITSIAGSGLSDEGLAEATHKELRPPEGLEIMQPDLTPNLSGVAGTGAQEHPPARISVTGESIILPVGITSIDEVRKLKEKGKVEEGLSDSANVTDRQLRRAA